MKQFLHFKSSVGRRLVCVDEVVEVIPMVFLQREDADSAQPNFCGFFNFRGDIVPVFNLSAYSQEMCVNPNFFLIVTHSESGLVAVLAYEVDYLLDVEDESLSVVNTKGKESGVSVFHVAKIQDEVVRIVRPQEFLA